MNRQNASQDELVWEFFDHRGEGYFVEVGANHPQQGSQTWLLEKAGWRGALVEPQASLFEAPAAKTDTGAESVSAGPVPGTTAVQSLPGGVQRPGKDRFRRTACPRRRVERLRDAGTERGRRGDSL